MPHQLIALHATIPIANCQMIKFQIDAVPFVFMNLIIHTILLIAKYLFIISFLIELVKICLLLKILMNLKSLQENWGSLIKFQKTMF